MTYTMKQDAVGTWLLYGYTDRRSGTIPWILAEVKRRMGRYHTTRIGISNGHYDPQLDKRTYYGDSFEDAVAAAIEAASLFKP